jgi:hypothetical protein
MSEPRNEGFAARSSQTSHDDIRRTCGSISTSSLSHGITASISARKRSRRVTLPFFSHATEENVVCCRIGHRRAGQAVYAPHQSARIPLNMTAILGRPGGRLQADPIAHATALKGSSRRPEPFSQQPDTASHRLATILLPTGSPCSEHLIGPERAPMSDARIHHVKYLSLICHPFLVRYPTVSISIDLMSQFCAG